MSIKDGETNALLAWGTPGSDIGSFVPLVFETNRSQNWNQTKYVMKEVFEAPYCKSHIFMEKRGKKKCVSASS